MPEAEESLKACEECGATVYPEHLERGMAEKWEGKLLCVHCLKDKRAGAHAATPNAPDQGTIELAGGANAPDVMGEAGAVVYDKRPTAIKSFGAGPAVGEVAGHEHRRSLLPGSPNATRCKTFHCKLADGPMAFMAEQINEWADADENIEIKFATSTIGVVEGKHVDPHLIVTVFY